MGGMARPKQYLQLAGNSVMEWAVAPFLRLEACERIVVVLSTDDPWWTQLPISRDPHIIVAQGGTERAESVAAGLDALSDIAAAEDWVLVHDAARPCLGSQDLHHLISVLSDDPVGGLLASPVVDTLKRADEAGYVASTVSREGLWRAMTPQMFKFGVLRRALAECAQRGLHPTDEAQAVEMLGLRPKLVTGSTDNLKITTADDLAHAERILAARGHA
jgi:2-C-methyl-D-erythritol 4-phosphate cytidylyltransferase